MGLVEDKLFCGWAIVWEYKRLMKREGKWRAWQRGGGGGWVTHTQGVKCEKGFDKIIYIKVSVSDNTQSLGEGEYV
jgi:hypothetical protein